MELEAWIMAQSLDRCEEILAGVLEKIDSHIVWSRSLDRPYQVWQAQARFLYAVAQRAAGGSKKEYAKALKEAREFVEMARGLPKARRDPDFRVLCEIFGALIELSDYLLKD